MASVVTGGSALIDQPSGHGYRVKFHCVDKLASLPLWVAVEGSASCEDHHPGWIQSSAPDPAMYVVGTNRYDDSSVEPRAPGGVPP